MIDCVSVSEHFLWLLTVFQDPLTVVHYVPRPSQTNYPPAYPVLGVAWQPQVFLYIGMTSVL